ncbi:hypothetical protein PFISCL1PPCAC_25705, partial [Pristionchus fissidentatus]
TAIRPSSSSHLSNRRVFRGRKRQRLVSVAESALIFHGVDGRVAWGRSGLRLTRAALLSISINRRRRCTRRQWQIAAAHAREF